MGTPNFFSDAVADMEVDDSYGNGNAFDRDDRVLDPAAAATAGTYQQNFSYQSTSRTLPARPSSLSQSYPTAVDTWTRLHGYQGSMEETLNHPIQHFDPALQPGGPKDTLAIPGDAQEIGSMMPSSRSTRSSITSIPRTNSKSTSQTLTPITPFEPPPLPPPPPPPPPSPPPAKKRKGRARKTSTALEEEAKRNRFLERNRVAASRCRVKKKEYVSDLEDQRLGLESKHTLLQMEHDSLLGEISRIKAMLMDHASCSDPNIDKWMENEARSFVQGASSRLDQTQGIFGQPTDHRHLSMASVGSAGSSYLAPSYDDSNPATRRASTGFSHTSSLQTSPVIPHFSFLPPPPLPQSRENVNYDNVPADDTFSPLQQHFTGR